MHEPHENGGTAWVVMGVSGCGKSEVGARLAQALRAVFIEGHRFHPAANVRKMSAGIPLTDAYRDTLRGAGCTVNFVHLAGARATIAARMDARAGHYMPLSLLDSQLRDLEPLQADEAGTHAEHQNSVGRKYRSVSELRTSEPQYGSPLSRG